LTILRDDPRLRLTLRPGMNIAYLAFNTDKPPLNNPAVRHALASAINNQRLMQLSITVRLKRLPLFYRAPPGRMTVKLKLLNTIRRKRANSLKHWAQKT
jgi:hypothetical protein